MSTSASTANSCKIAWPSAVFKLIQIDSLPALVLTAMRPSMFMARNGSPPNGSTLITRAPRSASIAIASGAAMIVDRSTTVMPSSGRPGTPATAASVGSVAARGTSEVNTSSVCWPIVGDPPWTDAGVATSSAIGAIWVTAPTEASSISTRPCPSTRSICDSASAALMMGSAATLPFSAKACIHSSAVRSCMRIRMRSRASSVASTDHTAGLPWNFSSIRNSPSRSMASRNE